jgi:hypothetical protein
VRIQKIGIEEQLKCKLLEKYSKHKIEALPTVGVEHEFFLVDEFGSPASLQQSQMFLQALSALPSWTVYRKVMIDGGSEFITQLSRDHSGKYSAVKYEFPPHLLEVAFSYHSDLDELSREIFSIWADLLTACRNSRMHIWSVPAIASPKLDFEKIYKIDHNQRSLVESRIGCFIDGNREVNQEAVNFPAFIAATQVHIGGYDWWNSPSIVRNLYLLEPHMQSFSYSLLKGSGARKSETLKSRWFLYREVFQDLKLLGFPDLRDWSFHDWVGALCDSPLVMSKSEVGYIPNLRSLQNSTSVDFLLHIAKARDLQIIKPKLIGTLEFRADPSLPGPDQILALAVARLAQYHCAISMMDHGADSYAEARKEWWSNVDAGLVCPRGSGNIMDHALSRLSCVYPNAQFWRSIHAA